VAQFDMEANRTRDDGVAKNATHRAARPDPSLRKERLLGITNQTEPLPGFQIAARRRVRSANQAELSLGIVHVACQRPDYPAETSSVQSLESGVWSRFG